jgi:hypothetical protein
MSEHKEFFEKITEQVLQTINTQKGKHQHIFIREQPHNLMLDEEEFSENATEIKIANLKYYLLSHLSFGTLCHEPIYYPKVA